MELDEVSPEARQSPPAKVFRDDSGERISPEADGVSPPSSLILMRDGEQESASDAGLYHARDAAGNYVGADLLSSSFDASNFGVRHDGAHDSSWESARSLVDSSGSGPGEWRAHDHHHHVVETGRPIARADDLISPPEFEDQWPGAEVRSKLERASTYEEWVEALLGAPDPEQPEGRTGEHHHDSERESSSASVDDLQFPFEFGDLRPDPEARSNDEWVEAIFDSAESIQSEGHTAEHHHEMDRGRTTEDEEDLSLPFELEDLWPEAEDRSSEEQWIKAFLAFPGASYPPSPAVPLTGEFEENYAEPRHQGDDGVSSTLTSIPDGKRLILNL
ncbi:hypothetical protein FOZ63_003981 [Perkinsus olseni]|uniref:Uncharacterized protein n=1 Tax=Perkinsus olseni TaxID=32597 RepID=A0A7J6T6M6_PEROL|nr:hypothetical protein FOZ63_003981 [Perkinsus olseni]